MARNKYTLPSWRKLPRVKRSVRVLGMGAQLIRVFTYQAQSSGSQHSGGGGSSQPDLHEILSENRKERNNMIQETISLEAVHLRLGPEKGSGLSGPMK